MRRPVRDDDGPADAAGDPASVFWERQLAALGGATALARRDFLKLVAAGAALAGASGCFRLEDDRILPYVHVPRDVVPGVSSAYATTMELDGFGVGLVVATREGRPIKVEGNPAHPASLGAAGVPEQASLLGLYDPDRLRGVRGPAGATDLAALRHWIASLPQDGRGLAVLLEPTASPGVREAVDRLRERRPAARVCFASPLRNAGPADAARALFGRTLEPLADLRRAAVVVALDADLLDAGPFRLRHAHDFAEGRRVRAPGDAMNRLYWAGPSPCPTSSLAERALSCGHAEVGELALALVSRLAAARGAPAALAGALAARPAADTDAQWIDAAAGDLLARPGASLVVAGAEQPAHVHALAHAANELLGNLGATVRLVPSPRLDAEGWQDGLEGLVEALRNGAVETLALLGTNPVYGAPADLDFGAALGAARTVLALAELPDESAARAHWRVGRLHWMESWGDARALDGTASLVQPLVTPLFDGWTVPALLAELAGAADRDDAARVRERWGRAGLAGADFDRALAEGVVAGSAAASFAAAPAWDAVAGLVRGAPRPTREGVELVFRADRALHDGRWANNPWLQELPDPVTRLTWGNGAWLAPERAAELGVEDGHAVTITSEGRSLVLPALVVAGQATSTVTLALGYGRGAGLSVAHGVGVDVGRLRTTAHRFAASGARIERTPQRHFAIARTQRAQRLDGRADAVARQIALAELGAAAPPDVPGAALYEWEPATTPQWGMVVDLTVCTGCSACVVACQAENNVPVVGADQVRRGREMAWLRVDRWETGDARDPRPISQPMLCQHCEAAPCEYVCPVGATVHSSDGLNEMVYNRCVGTRFCSNNCPYKVRRFNWFDWNAAVPELHRMQLNPDVTVRARGVMEKCTYCVQRIRGESARARRAGEPPRWDQVRTACQQACPTRAIQFGNVADPDSAVARDAAAPHAYGALAELGTRPRTRYLARLRDPGGRA